MENEEEVTQTPPEGTPEPTPVEGTPVPELDVPTEPNQETPPEPVSVETTPEVPEQSEEIPERDLEAEMANKEPEPDNLSVGAVPEYVGSEIRQPDSTIPANFLPSSEHEKLRNKENH